MTELVDEEVIARELAEVSKHADKNQRLAWRRKKKRIDDLVERLEPFQEKKLKLILEMQPIMDDINKVRHDMVKDCVHPLDYLAHKGTHIECKFCKTKIRLNRD